MHDVLLGRQLFHDVQPMSDFPPTVYVHWDVSDKDNPILITETDFADLPIEKLCGVYTLQHLVRPTVILTKVAAKKKATAKP